MEGYFERVVEVLTGAGYRWYETANFCLAARACGRARPARPPQPRLLARSATTSASAWARSRQSMGCAGGTRRASPATWRRSARGERPPRELEPLETRRPQRERVLLGLRLDEPLAARRARGSGRPACARAPRSTRAGRAARRRRTSEALALTRRGRFLGGGVTAELLGLDIPARWRSSPSASARSCGVVVEEYVATGQPVGSKGLVERWPAPGLVVDGPLRARRARDARPAHAPAHRAPAGCRPRRGYRLLRRRAARAARAAAGPVPARPDARCGARSRRRCSRRPRCSRR